MYNYIFSFWEISQKSIFELCSKILTLGFSQINLENHSLIRIFELRSKVGCISEIKINLHLFCISLNLHYL